MLDVPLAQVQPRAPSNLGMGQFGDATSAMDVSAIDRL